jgi:hypothetical protein
MSKFVKVAQWRREDYFEEDPEILYLSVDCIEKFYRINTDFTYYNFKPYFIADQVVLDYHIHPTKIIAKDGSIYYSPIDLNDSTKLDVEEIESRFDIIDL